MRISDWTSDVCSSDLHHHRRVRRIDRTTIAEAVVDLGEKARIVPGSLDGSSGRPLIVIAAPHQQRELRAKMRDKLGRQAVADRSKDGVEDMPCKRAAGAKIGDDFVEPYVRRLQGPVENLQASIAHLPAFQRPMPTLGAEHASIRRPAIEDRKSTRLNSSH